MGFGRKLPPGRLPVFSVDTEEEAKHLIALACPMSYDRKYYAQELAEEQTIPNLRKFSDRLAEIYEKYMKK